MVSPPLVEYDVMHMCEVNGQLALACRVKQRGVEWVEYYLKNCSECVLVLAPGPGIL